MTVDVDRFLNTHHLLTVLTLTRDGRIHSASPGRRASIHVHEDGQSARCITPLMNRARLSKFVRRYPCGTRWWLTRDGRKVLNAAEATAGSLS